MAPWKTQFDRPLTLGQAILIGIGVTIILVVTIALVGLPR